MADLVARVKRRCRATADNWKNDRHFSGKLAVLRFADDIGNRLGLHSLATRAHKQKDEFILDYLQNLIAPVIERYKDDTYQGEEPKSAAPIWVCWWSGEKSAPELVKQCIKSIRKNAGCHPVNLVTETNVGEYLNVNQCIYEKFKAGHIGAAHFSDYLRVSLLEQYGGIWLDATMFCSQAIPEEFFNLPFFTCKSEVKKGYYISDFQWVTFCLAGWKHNVFYRFMKDAFEYYWCTKDTAIDYLFFDAIIYIAKKTIPSIRILMENVPLNNLHRDDLQAAMNAALPAEEFWNIVKEDTVFYKLSWRESYSKKAQNGVPTVYDYFLKMSL